MEDNNNIKDNKDNKFNEEGSPDLPIKSAEEMLVEEFEEVSDERKKKRKIVRIVLSSLSIILGVIILSIIGLIFKLDSYIFPSRVFGIITDFANRPLEGAQICISSECVMTDNTGYFKLGNIKYGNSTITINMERYYEFSEDIYIERGSNEFNRQLQPFGFGEIKGVLGTSGEVILDGLELKLDDEVLLINDDLSFLARDKMIGTYVLSLSSPFYKDFSTDIKLKEGTIDLGEVVLDPARDIEFELRDHINDSVLKDVKIKIGDIELLTNEAGLCKFIDLDLSLSYTYSASRAGYITKEKSIAIEDYATLFPKEEIDLIRTGKVVYTSNRTGNYNVYASNYDGSNEIRLSDDKGNNYDPEILSDGSGVMFLSTRDGIKDAYGQPVALLYRVGLDGSQLTKISKTNYEDFGSIGKYSIPAMKRAFVKYTPGGLQELYFGNIDGTYMAIFYSNLSFTGSLHDLMIAPDGRSIFLSLSDSKSGTLTEYLVRINIQTGQRTDLATLSPYTFTRFCDISNDKALVISSGFGDQVVDIYTLNMYTGDIVRVSNNTNSEIHAYYSPDYSSIYYYDSRDSKTDIFVRRAPDYNEIRLTSSGKISAIVDIKSDAVFYMESGKLMVMDPNYPALSEEVTGNITIFPYWEY